MYHVHAGAHGGQERVSDLLALELRAAMTCHVGPGNPVQVVCKSSKCSHNH